jgi:hypothetical protein
MQKHTQSRVIVQGIFKYPFLTRSGHRIRQLSDLYAAFMHGPENPYRFLICIGLSALKLHIWRSFHA